MSNLGLKLTNNFLCQTPGNGDGVLIGICKYQNHPCIKTILKIFNFSFSLKAASLTDKENEIKTLDVNKASHLSDILYKNSKIQNF